MWAMTMRLVSPSFLLCALCLLACGGERPPDPRVVGDLPYDSTRKHERDFSPTGEFEQLSESLFRLTDCCNVYVIRNEDRALLVDFGSGRILDFLGDIGISSIDMVLVTHHHRDQVQGLPVLKGYPLTLVVPAGEAHLFEDVERFWNGIEMNHRFNCRGDYNSLGRNVQVGNKVSGGQQITWEGLVVKVLDTPGNTPNSVSYVTEVDGRKIVFSGDLISGTGKVTNWHDLHWRYYGFTTGIDASDKSFEKVKLEEPEWLAPSHGALIKNPEEAMASNSRIYERLRPMLKPNELHKPTNDIREILPHLFFLGGNSYVILSESGKAFIYDVGWDFPGDVSMERLKTFKEEHQIESIDVVSFSHHHGDHKNRLPDLFRQDDPEVWVFENMVDIFENPTRYKLPGRPLGVYADRILNDKEKVQWEEYTLEFTSFPSQLQYHQALFAVIDGKKVLFTGDGSWKPIDPDRSMNGPVIPHQDYCLDGGYITCTRKMLEYLPDIVCPSHTEEYYPTKEQLEEFYDWSVELREVMTELVDQPDPNFGMDARWCHFYPYRLVVNGEEIVELELRVRNYLYIPAVVEVELKLPPGLECHWRQGSCVIPAKKEVAIPFQLRSAEIEEPGRAILTADITVNGSHLGEYPEALVELRLPVSRY